MTWAIQPETVCQYRSVGVGARRARRLLWRLGARLDRDIDLQPLDDPPRRSLAAPTSPTGNIMPAKRKYPIRQLETLPTMKQFPSSVEVATSAEREEAMLEEYQRLLREDDAIGRDVLLLIGMITAVSFVCSVDRAAMSVTILPMSEQFGWDSSVKGAVSSSFFAGYMITNIFGGYLATRFSPQYVLAAGVLLWSLFTLDTPLAAQASTDSLTSLLVVRAVMGIGEGVAYPSIQNIVRKSVPDQVRTRGLSFIYSVRRGMPRSAGC